MTRRRRWIAVVALLTLAAGCGGRGDDRPDIAVTGTEERPAAAAPTTVGPTEAAASSTTPHTTSATTLRRGERSELEARAADVAAAVRRWDVELAACVGPAGDGDDSDATCTHASWEQLVDQVEIEMDYLLDQLRAMPRGPCHDAVAAENNILRGFWHGAAPLDLAWLDEQQRPPSLFDLETAVDLVRPISARLREAVTTVCAA